jgi:GNAT superfamily N-acetyltransferase
MKIIQTPTLTLDQKQALFELWNSEYPEKIGYAKLSEFENYLDGLSNKENYLVVDDQNQILGWAFTFFREDKDWFGIIVNSEIQGKGLGKLLLDELKKSKSVLNGWVIDHQNDLKQNKEPYLSPLGFYTKNGFLVHKNNRIENEKISAVKISWESSRIVAR